jgi:hypothetical protein
MITSSSYDLIVPGVKIVENASASNVLTITNVRVPAVIGTANWGPDDEIVAVTSVADLLDKYGDRSGGNLVKFVETMLLQGAGYVKCLRMPGGSGVEATRKVDAGAATTWDFEALYEGTDGNSITIQVVAGSLSGKVTVIVIRNGITQRVENVDNTESSADYIGTKWACDWVTFTKTGTATTQPTPDGAAVAMANGANGSTPSDGDIVTKMADFEADISIDMIGHAFTDSAALRTGMLNHCTKMWNRIYFMSPVDPSSKSTIIAEMAAYNDMRGVVTYPALNYYNSETGAYEDQYTAWYMGIVARNAPNQAPIGTNYGFVRGATLKTAISYADSIDYVTAHVAIGVSSPSEGYYILNQSLEYRDDYFGKIQIRQIYDKIEGSIDAGLAYLVGYGGGLTETKIELNMALMRILEYYKALGYLYDYRIVLDANTAASRLRAEAYADVYLEIYPGLEKIVIHVGKLDDYQIVVREELV